MKIILIIIAILLLPVQAYAPVGRWYPLVKTVKADNSGMVLEVTQYWRDDVR